TFDNQYNGNDIWDGSAYTNGWDGATASGGTTADYSLNGTNLLYNMSTNNGWLQHDNNATPWEAGSGSWTVEVRARVGSTGGNSGFVIWGALNGERDILTVRENAVTSLAGTSYDSSDNTDGFHDFRLVYDASADVYHYFRDAVQITPLTGVGQQAGTGSTRLIVGDCCSNIGGSPFGGVGSSFEVEYIRYDMDGAFSPTSDQGTTVVTINRDTGNIALTNTTSTAIQNIIGYSILSSAGSLSQSGWNQQAGGSQLANDDDNWTVLTSGGDTTDLSEAVLSTSGAGDGGDLAATTGSWNFGNVWTKSPFEDVVIELLLDDGTILNSGADFQLSYTGNGDQPFGLGDLAGATINDGPDGDIDLVDWQKFKAGFGSDLAGLTGVEAYFAGDLTGDGESNLSDFNAFRSLYDAENGLGALALALSGATVPEPTTWALLSIGASSLIVRRRAVKFAGAARLALLAALCIIASGSNATAQVPVTVFSDDFQAYPTGDPAVFSATGNWTHNGNGTGSNASRIFDTINYGGTRLWIASAANAAAGTGIDSRGITSAEGLLGNTDYTFSAAMVSETFDGTRTATGTYNLLIGQTFGTATSVIGGPQAFSARGDHDAGLAGSVDDTYDDQRTTLAFNSGTVNAGDQLFISIAFDGTDATNPFVGIDEVEIIGSATIGARVNTATGKVSLFGDSAFDFDITGYRLTSTLGQLVPGNFTSLEGQGVGDPGMSPNDGIGFEVLGSPSVSAIAEGHLTTFTTFDNATDLSIGNVFNTATLEGDRDLALTLTTASGEELTAVVEYVSTVGLAGDFNA
ncbi:MAG: PEP-CTERM sorting domain-containing protein, partial [Planctomycetales bacterium]|nr:PEP-CTERM sorting domain-containing protein [Planctomycetales bacterium]